MGATIIYQRPRAVVKTAGALPWWPVHTASTRRRVFAVHPGVVPTRRFLSYNLEYLPGIFVPPERAGCHDAGSGRYLAVDDDLEALLEQADKIARSELLILRSKVG